MTDDVYRDINQIAGYPLTILIILRAEHVATRTRIMEVTGLSLPTLRKHITKLELLGYIKPVGEYHNQAYAITDKIKELFFIDMSTEKFLQIELNINKYIDSLTKKDSINNNNGSTEKFFQIENEVTEALKQAGILDPTRSRLAVLSHVTIEFVEAHIYWWKKERELDPAIGTGYLVNRIKDNVPVDPIPRLCKVCGRTLLYEDSDYCTAGCHMQDNT